MITIGSYISLSTQLSKTAKLESARKVYLHAEHTFNPKAYARQAIGDKSNEADHIANVHTISYRIVPTCTFTERKDLARLQAKLADSEKRQLDNEDLLREMEDGNAEVRQKDRVLQKLEELEKAREGIEKEIRDKQAMVQLEEQTAAADYESRIGKPLAYGQNVQLVHCFTRSCIAAAASVLPIA